MNSILINLKIESTTHLYNCSSCCPKLAGLVEVALTGRDDSMPPMYIDSL